MLFGAMSLTERMNLALSDPEKIPMSIAQIVTEEVREFRASSRYKEMLLSLEYYHNRSDVQTKTNDVEGRANTKIEQPALKKLIDQKANYLLGKPFTILSDEKAYSESLNNIFSQEARHKIKLMCKDAPLYGISWIQPYFKNGELVFMRIPATELIPLWTDSEKTDIGAFIRVYDQTVYIGNRKNTVTRAELWHENGVTWFCTAPYTGAANYEFSIDKDHGTEKNNYTEPHFTLAGKGYNWTEIPIAWVKYNEDELPLLHDIKEIADDINWQKSITADVLRDVINFVYVLRNYGGQDLAEFLTELKKHKAIKVDTDGGVDKLTAELNIDAVVKHMESLRRDLYDYASGVDTQDPNLGNASGLAIYFRYMGLDTDCAAIGEEFKAMFYRLKLFIDTYLQIRGNDFSSKNFEVTFNMDLPVNESEIIINAKNSKGMISDKTILANHPWVKDVDEEIEQLKKEKSQAIEQYGEGLFGNALSAGGATEIGVDDGGNK